MTSWPGVTDGGEKFNLLSITWNVVDTAPPPGGAQIRDLSPGSTPVGITLTKERKPSWLEIGLEPLSPR